MSKFCMAPDIVIRYIMIIIYYDLCNISCDLIYGNNSYGKIDAYMSMVAFENLIQF